MAKVCEYANKSHPYTCYLCYSDIYMHFIKDNRMWKGKKEEESLCTISFVSSEIFNKGDGVKYFWFLRDGVKHIGRW